MEVEGQLVIGLPLNPIIFHLYRTGVPEENRIVNTINIIIGNSIIINKNEPIISINRLTK